MALTLLESLKHFTTLPEDVQPLIIEKYAGSSDILMNLPFVDAPSGTYAYRNRSQYPSVGFRAIGGSYAQTNGVINLQKESVFDLGGNIILDAFIADLQNGMGLDALTNEAEATATAAGLHWTAKFFKGDSRTGVEFDGLQNRLSGDRVLHTDNGSGSHTSGGDAISFKTLRIAKSLVLNPSCWIMSRQMKLKIDDAATNPDVAGYLTISPGQLGLEANMLMGLPIYTVDLDDAGNEILPFQEAAAGGGSGCTSIYCLSMGAQAVHGIQMGPMTTKFWNQIPGQEYYQATIKWRSSFVMENPRAAMRIDSIKDAAIVRGD